MLQKHQDKKNHKKRCLKSHFSRSICHLLIVLQRVNPLVPNMLQNLNRRIYPSEHLRKRENLTFDIALFW